MSLSSPSSLVLLCCCSPSCLFLVCVATQKSFSGQNSGTWPKDSTSSWWKAPDSHEGDRNWNEMLSCVEITKIGGADGNSLQLWLGFSPLWRSWDIPLRLVFKVRFSWVGKVLRDLCCVSCDFSAAFRTCFMGKLQGKLQGALWV